MLTRRGIITGLVSFVVAPAIVKIENIMPVKVMATIEPLPYLTADEFLMEIYKPFINKLAKEVAESIMNGSPYEYNFTELTVKPVLLKDFYK